MELAYRLFAEIDRIVYSLVSQVLLLIEDLSKYNFFSSDTVRDFTGKVYVILGVLMLFKLVISAIQYLLNPDTFEDKNKGLGSILTKTIISVALLVLTPAIFDFAMDIQDTIVEALPNIVFGSEKISKNNFQTAGDSISVTILSSFLQLKENATSTVSITSVQDFPKIALDGCNSSILSKEFWLGTNCKYQYTFIISTIVGGALVYILVSMAIDIGIRSIKMGIVQILAPIPIVSYISDEKKFTSWVQMSLQIYADLFIRMAIIYFIIYFLQVVLVDTFTTTGILENELGAKVNRTIGFLEIAWVKIFIIVALLLFAKNAPKFICDLLGIKGADESIGNMFKRAGGLFGTTLGGIRTARSNYTTQKERFAGKGATKGRQIAEGLRSAVAGFGSATARGAVMSAQGKGFKDVRQNAFKNAIGARNRRVDKLDNLYNRSVDKHIKEIDSDGNVKYVKNPEYYGRLDAWRDVRREKLGIPSDTAFIKARYDVMEQTAKIAADARGHGSGKMNETPNRYKVSFRNERGANKGKFKNTDFEIISNALGYESLTMEQVRNLYTLARNGQELEKADGSGTVKLNEQQLGSLGSILQLIEKRTSYLKEAEMMATGDPTATPNVEKISMAITNNESMFNDPKIMEPIIEKMKKYGYEILSVKGLKNYVDTLKESIKEPKRENYASDDEYNKAVSKYFDTINERADILNGIKDAFEEVTKQQFAPAQVADARAKKAQQAISNNDKKS